MRWNVSINVFEEWRTAARGYAADEEPEHSVFISLSIGVGVEKYVFRYCTEKLHRAISIVSGAQVRKSDP